MTIHSIRRTNGIAGQFAITAEVSYPGEDKRAVTFTGSTYGGPVVMVTPAMPRGMFVSDPSRFGEFGTEWARRFFEAS